VVEKNGREGVPVTIDNRIADPGARVLSVLPCASPDFTMYLGNSQIETFTDGLEASVEGLLSGRLFDREHLRAFFNCRQQIYASYSAMVAVKTSSSCNSNQNLLRFEI
jgi:hypothetical protein